MEPNPLVGTLESLNHEDRIKTMVKLGREAITSSEARSSIQDLENAEGFYGKFLALQSCLGSRQSQKAIEFLSSTSNRLRAAAQLVLVRIASDDELVQVPDYPFSQWFLDVPGIRVGTSGRVLPGCSSC